jgi:hypothetical protein
MPILVISMAGIVAKTKRDRVPAPGTGPVGPRAMKLKLLALAALFAAGLLLGSGLATGSVQQLLTTTETTVTTLLETTTEPGTTSSETTTVQETVTAPGTTVITTSFHTTTRRVIVHPATTSTPTTTSGESTSSTPTWVWVVLALLAAGLITALVLLLTRRGHGLSAQERRRRLDGAIATWAAQGWAIESETEHSAVLRRGDQLMRVGVDQTGQVSTQQLTGDEPTQLL